MSRFSRPRAIQSSDPVAEFDCGETSLNIWLSGRAIKNESTGASRTFVSIERENSVVDERFTGSGLGASLRQDALLKCILAARSVGIRAVVVDASNESAENFYRKFGFEAMPLANDGAMFLLVKDAEATILHGR